MLNSKIDLKTRIKLNNGIEMPIIGFGTWQLNGRQAEESMSYALSNGYRLIDTAKIYLNEFEIGNSIKKSGIPREELFITTKLWPQEQGYKSTISACEKSLNLLGMSYIDLYLIHWPVIDFLYETWNAMEILLKQGKCRAIGVSNYMVQHLKYLLSFSSVRPVVNQVEFNPYNYQKIILKFCSDQNIQLESYCPLTRGLKLNDQRLITIASKYRKSTAQLLIRWALQKNLVTITKSSRKVKIRENIDVFDFNIITSDMNTLDLLNENLHIPLIPF